MELPGQIRFDGWILRPDSGELCRDGVTVRLQDKPLLILTQLLLRPGELVTREQLIARLWPQGIVEFDVALNAAMRRLRAALQDDADAPRYIETVPRKGYRFIGKLDPVDSVVPHGVSPGAPATAPMASAARAVPTHHRGRLYAAGGLAALVLAAFAIISARQWVRTDAGQTAARQQARQLWQEGMALLGDRTMANTQKASALFSRASVLDPTFAPSYAGTGMSLLQLADLRRGWESVCAEAGPAFDRALQLDPELSDAWIGRATCTQDPVLAEQLFHAGLRFAPDNAMGYVRLAQFMFWNRRRAEAIEFLDRALQRLPRSPELLQLKAFYVMVVRNDLAEHNALLRKALAINPHFYPALYQLAEYTYFFSGEFAESIRLIEQAIAADPQADDARSLAAMMYLDVDDPVAADRVLAESTRAFEGRILLAQYQGDAQRAADIASPMTGEWWRWTHHSCSPFADAIRDQAVASGNYASALHVLDTVNSNWNWPPLAYRGFTPVYAHLLILAGDRQRGRDMAREFLDLTDAEATGRPPHWFARERSQALEVLGEHERSLQELAESQNMHHWVRWWYLADFDPLYRHLHEDRRFQQLAAQASQHRREQRERLDEMRRRGEVPM
jgi:DNA-binding winged helix-turn-helix (wHTH) protein/Tfp pilus assembly protein PilF